MEKRWRVALVLAAMVTVGACAPGEEADVEGEPGAAMQSPPPDTTVEALWAHLEAENYEENWALYPDKGRLYAGQEPHGMLLTSYVNGLAQAALRDPEVSVMPTGAIVIKENYMPDSTLAAVTVMYKAAGFDPDNNNWYWLKRNADGSVDAAGRGQGCINCHGARRDNDFIFTSSLTEGM